ncbi:hypothetical protein [Paraglaciecola marina]|uniref:hypothetical protein n=1 Tax=Paraglaciecola marina TaxID=2500157 RepID=UPI00106139C3|nr:hypothetical protein [Paraglaciecola marina]
MTKDNEPSEEALAKLYSKRKAAHLAPVSIKRKLLEKQTSHKTTTAIFNRISYVAVAASTLLLISIMMFRNVQFNKPQLAYQSVEIHTLNNAKDLSSEGIRNRYAQHYKDYLNQRKTYAQHHQKRAVLSVTENIWQLKTCDDEVMQLSEELISALTDLQQIDMQLNSGDVVEIAFDQSGIILGIQRSYTPLSC